MTCVYKHTMKDLIQSFMQIMNYMSWLKAQCSGECLDSTLLKLKATTKYGNPNVLAGLTQGWKVFTLWIVL